jgi:hypothetical protein
LAKVTFTELLLMAARVESATLSTIQGSYHCTQNVHAVHRHAS